MGRRLLLIAFAMFHLAPGVCLAADRLTLWVHPYLPATEITQRFTPLAKYLGEKLGLNVSVRVQQTYQSHLDFVGRDRADIAYLGPASYIRLRDQYGPKPLLAKLEVAGKPFFHGMIVVRHDSGLKSISDLAGKSFAFGDPNSTMSYFVPRGMLLQAGVKVADLQRHDFLNSHHNVALAVLGGYFDAGGVKEEVFYEFEKKGLRILAQSPPLPEHLFVTRANLPAEMVEQIRTRMLAIGESPDKAAILGSLKSTVTNLLPVADRDYDPLREILSALDR
jgi:phosphonate transport system substrate-binding protein